MTKRPTPTGSTFHQTIREEKYPKGRAIVAAFWISYFTLHWLLILEVLELTIARAFCLIYFLLASIIVSINVAAHELAIAKEEKNE